MMVHVTRLTASSYPETKILMANWFETLLPIDDIID